MKDLNKIKELCPSAYDFIVNKAEGAAVGKYDLENGAYVSVQVNVASFILLHDRYPD